MRKFYALGCLFVFSTIGLTAQRNKVISSISNKEKIKIEREITSRFVITYRNLINLITNPNEDLTDKTDAISNSLTDIFQSKDSRMEVDLKSNYINSSNIFLTVDQYLDQMKEQVKGENNEAIEFNFKNSDFRYFTNKEGSLYCVVSFSQKWKASDVDSKKLKPANRKAILKLEKDGPEWTIRIESILFENTDDKIANQSNWQQITVSGTEEFADDNMVYDKEYCYNRYKQGYEYLKFNEYAKAFFCLTQASQFKEDNNLIIDIQKAQNDLKKAIRDLSDKDEDWTILIAHRLTQEAKELEKSFNYLDAFSYINLAKSTDRSDPSNVFVTTYDKIKTKADKIKILNGLYNNGKFEEGISEFTTAINEEPSNSYLYAGLAKCYSGKSKKIEADSLFLKAILLDPENTAIYLMQAEHLKSNEKYQEAEKVYITYLGKANKLDPNYKKAQANNALCKALELFSKNPAESKATCDTIIQKYASLPDAYLLLSKLVIANRNSSSLFPQINNKTNYITLASAFADSAIVRGLKSEGYAQKAKILVDKKLNLTKGSKEDRNCEEEIIYNFNKSIDFDKRNYTAYKELGDFYLNMGLEAMYKESASYKEYIEKAMKQFAVPMADTAHKALATIKWKMSKCKYAIGLYKEADDLIQSIKFVMGDRIDQFNNDFALIKLKNNQISIAKQYADKSNSNTLSKYIQLLCNMKITPGYVGSKTEEELKKIFDGIDQYNSTMIENDFKELGLEINSKVKSAIKKSKA